MPLLFGIILVSLAALFQGVLVARLTDGPRPDLTLLIVLALSTQRGLIEGTLAGLAGGLTLDLLSAAPFGLHAGLLATLAAAVALADERLFRGNLPLFVLAVALAALILHGGSLLALQSTGQQTPGFSAFLRYVVPTLTLDAILMPMFYWLVRFGVRSVAGTRRLEL